MVDRNVEGMMLKKTNRRGFWKKQGVYEDHVGAARYFIGEFEVNWRQHVQSIPQVVDPQLRVDQVVTLSSSSDSL